MQRNKTVIDSINWFLLFSTNCCEQFYNFVFLVHQAFNTLKSYYYEIYSPKKLVSLISNASYIKNVYSQQHIKLNTSVRKSPPV